MRDYISLRAQALLAKKPVKRGDVILTSKPFCTLLDSSVVGCYCEYCFVSFVKDRLLTRCSGCGRAYYCSEMCQELGRALHWRECVVFRRRPNYQPKDSARFLARLIWVLKDGGEARVEKIDDKRSRRFKDLVSHRREVSRDEEQTKNLDSLMPDLRQLVGKRVMPTRDYLLEIFGKVRVNSFCLLDDRLTPIGTSLYLAASYIDHDCHANAFVTFFRNKLVVRSLVDWPNLDWSRVRISYLDIMNTRTYRQDYLARHYYFTCDCRLCRDDAHDLLTSTVPCGSCGEPVYLDEEAEDAVGPCDACGNKSFPDNLRQDYRRVADLTRLHLKDLDEANPDLEVWMEVVAAQEGLMHPLNLLRAKALDAQLMATFVRQGWHTAWGLAKKNHAAMRHYYGAKHPTYGLFLMRLGKIELCNLAFSDAFEHLREAEEILEAGLGSNHRLVFDDLTWLLIQASEEKKIQIQRSLIYGNHLTAPSSRQQHAEAHSHAHTRGRS
ncbi:histone-lysine N-methyltransferase SMYD3-like [Scylla paramamosain]